MLEMEINKVTHQALEQALQEEINNTSNVLLLINNLVTELLNNCILYEKEIQILKPDKVKILERKKDLIYSKFFELQNLINLYRGKKMMLTFVWQDDNGNSHIELYKNNTDELSINKMYSKRGYSFDKLMYMFHSVGQELQNELSASNNENLQETTKEVIWRYENFKHKILWPHNGQWLGYKLTNMGPINEAFAGHYINNIILPQGNLNRKIHSFMLNNKYGVIAADNANGFLIGDTKRGNIEFAIKGTGGGPQSITAIKNALLILQSSGVTPASLGAFINTFTKVESTKATPLIKQLTERQVMGVVRSRFNTDKINHIVKIF